MTDSGDKLSQVPHKPGVYLMYDDQGRVIYVGKAGDLKKRLASYFHGISRHDAKTALLVNHIHDFETILTSTENEALILESNLIKKYRPRYNVILKDDKRYPSLRLDPREPYPGIHLVRKVKKDGALYFGPFSSPGAVYQTLKLINKTFKLRKCKDRVFRNRTRPCLNYQIGSCLGPCCRKVDPAHYQAMVQEVIWFLKGRTPELLKTLKQKMVEKAEAQEYEAAAEIRDRLFALEKTLEKQVTVSGDFADRDVLGLAATPQGTAVTLLFVRNGVLQGSRNFDLSESLSPDPETVAAFLRQYYEKDRFVPTEILLPLSPADSGYLEQSLSEQKGRKVRLLTPQRGEKARLLKMAMENAQKALREMAEAGEANQRLLEKLRKELGMDPVPARIECFDNSNIAGTHAVGAMVAFENGRPAPAGYRKHRIPHPRVPDDYAYMKAMLRWRFTGETPGGYPDLLVVDGGKGQLNIAVAVAEELGITGGFALIGIAKKDEKKGETADKIYKPGRANPLKISPDCLFLLQRVRDEAHRYAISFHRKRRGQAMKESALDGVPGVGPARKRALIQHFGSIKKIREAGPEAISQLSGISPQLAETIKRHLS